MSLPCRLTEKLSFALICAMELDLVPDVEKALAERIARGCDPNQIIDCGIRAVDKSGNDLIAALQEGLDDLGQGRVTVLQDPEAIQDHLRRIGQNVEQTAD